MSQMIGLKPMLANGISTKLNNGTKAPKLYSSSIINKEVSGRKNNTTLCILDIIVIVIKLT
jgi:hypothetical protein